MKEKINEHDMTKAMMSILRGGYKSKLLSEDINQEIRPDNDDQRDTISPTKGDAVFKDELKKLQDIVDPSAQITNFKIYPSDRNVFVEGRLLEGQAEDSGIMFRMELKKRDIETSMNNIELDDDVSGVLNRLQGYYKNWCNEWAKKITTEFNQRQD
jgi:hypothetical protein